MLRWYGLVGEPGLAPCGTIPVVTFLFKWIGFGFAVGLGALAAGTPRDATPYAGSELVVAGRRRETSAEF